MEEQLARNAPALHAAPADPVSFRAAADRAELEGRTGRPLSRRDVFFKALAPSGLYIQSGVLRRFSQEEKNVL